MSTLDANPFASAQFNALDFLLGKPSSPEVVYESDASSGLVPIQYNQSSESNHHFNKPEIHNNVDFQSLDLIFNDVISRPMEELDQLLEEAGIDFGQPKNINPVDGKNEAQAASSSDFGSSEPHSQSLQMPIPDDIVLLQVEPNSNETIMPKEPCVPVEQDPRPVEQDPHPVEQDLHPDEHRVVKRKMASKSRKPLKPIEKDSNSSMNIESPDVSSPDELMTDRRKRNHRRAQQTYTKRISCYFKQLRVLLSLKKSTSYTACLDKVTTEIRYLMRRVDSLTEQATELKKEASVRNKLVEFLQQDNERLRHEVNRLQQTNSDLHQGLESKICF